MKNKLKIFLFVFLIFCIWYFFIHKPRLERQSPVSAYIESDQDHILWGYPEGHDVVVFEYEGYVSGYDTLKLNPRWVSYNLKKEYIYGKKYLKERKFAPDPRLERHQTAVNSDYTRSGYDRGHLARQSNMKGRSLKCELEACYFTNISPQKPDFNRVVWSKIEQTAINLTRNYDESWLIVGPYFDNKITKIKNKIEIPDGFYKIVILKTGDGFLPVAFLLDHYSKSLNPEDYLADIDSVESLTGLDFFHELEDSIENVFESKLAPLPSGWKE
ncbi:MAG: DNA/RNA non-specific endonuclease [Candidatus Delongbacteria bacterium]|nr:DNA/RNA non-specific endonuclease [Candidatus Delongbacteria bacterium]